MTNAQCARWLLLALLITGVAGMHTMGHPHEAHASISGMYTETAVHHTAPHPDPQLSAAGHGSDMDAMCLAILTTTASLLLLGLSLVTAVRHFFLRHRRGIPRHQSRGPPRLVPPCLAITAMTVLRI